jgi:hypothetical protein
MNFKLCRMSLTRIRQTIQHLLILAILQLCILSAEASKAHLNADGVLVIDGRRVFPIGFTMPPPLNGKTPEGRNAIKELADTGATFLRTGPPERNWDEAALKEAQRCLDVAAKHKMYVWVNLRENSSIKSDSPQRERMLRTIVTRFKDHPGMGTWKGFDEPEWGKEPLPGMERCYQIVKEIDPHHPIVLIQAPRGTMESLRRYNHVADIVGTDIYPIGYPPGAHSGMDNREMSMVGDYTRRMVELAGGEKGIWMTLQIYWSGVIPPKKIIRFPTFPEQRFMVYDAIINGARGLMFFGGALESGMSPEDRKLGWNWQFWNNVQRRIVAEIGTKSPLYPALLEPNSQRPIKVDSKEIEFCQREVNGTLFLIAAKRTSGSTVKVNFSGLPEKALRGDVLFESPREVQLKDGSFTDWFAPFEVHVYQIKPVHR